MFKGGAKGPPAKAQANDPSTLAAGWILKRGEGNKAYKRRYALLQQAVLLRYFKSDEDSVPSGTVNAHNYEAHAADDGVPLSEFPMELDPIEGSGEARTYHLKATSEAGLDHWMAGFARCRVNPELELRNQRREMAEEFAAKMREKETEAQATENKLAEQLGSVNIQLEEAKSQLDRLTRKHAQQTTGVEAAVRALAAVYCDIEGKDPETLFSADKEIASVAGVARTGVDKLRLLALRLQQSPAISFAVAQMQKDRRGQPPSGGGNRRGQRRKRGNSEVEDGPRSGRLPSPAQHHAASSGPASSPPAMGRHPEKAVEASSEVAAGSSGVAAGEVESKGSDAVVEVEGAEQAKVNGVSEAEPATAAAVGAGEQAAPTSEPAPAAAAAASTAAGGSAGNGAGSGGSSEGSPRARRSGSQRRRKVKGGSSSRDRRRSRSRSTGRRGSQRRRRLSSLDAHGTELDALPTPASGKHSHHHHQLLHHQHRHHTPHSSLPSHLGDRESVLSDGTSKPPSQRLQEFYALYDPAKVPDVPKILKAFEGRLHVLWSLLEEKYKRSAVEGSPSQFMIGGMPRPRFSSAGSAVESALMSQMLDSSASDADSQEDLAQALLRANPPRWIEDKAAKACQICMQKFHLLRRRHHCRRCGRCICDDCAPSELEKCIPEFGYFKPVRHCKDCFGL